MPIVIVIHKQMKRISYILHFVLYGLGFIYTKEKQYLVATKTHASILPFMSGCLVWSHTVSEISTNLLLTYLT